MMKAMPPVRLAPSLLSADQTDLRSAIDACAAMGIDVLHLDVMDGHYVPNLTFGPKVALDLMHYLSAREYPIDLDVHLMVTEPDRFIPEFAKAKPQWLTVHVEAPYHPHRSLQLIRDHGCRPGLSLNPGTPLESLSELIDDVELILLMSVNPGYSGQQFIPGSLDKIRRCRALLDARASAAVIEVDGGVGPNNIGAVIAAGARMIVVGNAAFAVRPGQTIQDNLASLQSAIGAASVS